MYQIQIYKDDDLTRLNKTVNQFLQTIGEQYVSDTITTYRSNIDNGIDENMSFYDIVYLAKITYKIKENN